MNSQIKTYNTQNFAVLSISYEKANAEIRSKFAFFDEHVKSFVNEIHDKKLGDAFILSTCNRTEIYTTTCNHQSVAEMFCKSVDVSINDFNRFVNIIENEDALNHLFRVSAGLESQILGDFEIIGQIKNAYHRFKKYKKFSNPYLERAINLAIQISKRIKNETGISNGAASVSYAAVHYILKTQNQISDKNILLLGVGEIGQNTVENLVKHVQNPKIKIANRSIETAEKIAEKYKIPQIAFENFEHELKSTDILIVATGAQKPIILPKHFPNGKETLVIDLSIPNNVDKKVAKNTAVKLVDIDELSIHIEETLEQRKKEIPRAEAIINEMIKDFLIWEKKRKFAPNIHQFKSALKKIEDHEMHNFYRKHKYIDVDDMKLSEKMIQKITNRFAKYIIENPLKAEEITKLMNDILVEQPKQEFNKKHQ